MKKITLNLTKQDAKRLLHMLENSYGFIPLDDELKRMIITLLQEQLEMLNN